MKRQPSYQVKDVAQLSGVSVRTLHHYDQIGLLVASGRTSAGYRLYDDEDLLRLQQILIGRELGLTLSEIRRSLDDADFDRRQALVSQKRALQKRARQTAEMIQAVDAALAMLSSPDDGKVETEKKAKANMEHKSTTPMSTLFNGFSPEKYEAEAETRWGKTDAYKESSKRTPRYTANDWKEVQAEQASLYAEAFSTLTEGKAPDTDEAMAVAERHRLSIERWFYPCNHSMHTELAAMYEADERFAANIDQYGAGLTSYLAASIRANAARQGE